MTRVALVLQGDAADPRAWSGIPAGICGGLEAAVQLDGAAIPGSPWDSGSWVVDYLNSWSWTIAGGTNEIQRTVIGEQLLGLPR